MVAFAVTLIALGSVLALLNWYSLIASLCGDRFVSAVPLIGAFLLGSGMILLPQTRPFAWIALIADYGTLVFLIALPRIVAAIWSTCRFNLLHSFDLDEPGRHFTIKLFRRHIALISAQFDPFLPCNDDGACIGSFGWGGKWHVIENGYSIHGYCAERQLLLMSTNGNYSTTELHYPAENKYDYDSLDDLTFKKRK